MIKKNVHLDVISCSLNTAIIHNHPPTYTWPVSHPYLAYVSEIQARAPKHSAKRCRMSCEIWCIHTAEMVVLRSYKIMYIRYTYIYTYICVYVYYTFTLCILYIYTHRPHMTTWYHMHIVKRCNRSLDSALAFSLDVMVGKPCMANVEKQCIWELCSSTLTSCDILWHLMTMSWLTICESVGQSPAWLLSVQPLTGSPPAPDSRISTWNQKSYCKVLKRSTLFTLQDTACF